MSEFINENGIMTEGLGSPSVSGTKIDKEVFDKLVKERNFSLKLEEEKKEDHARFFYDLQAEYSKIEGAETLRFNFMGYCLELDSYGQLVEPYTFEYACSDSPYFLGISRIDGYKRMDELDKDLLRRRVNSFLKTCYDNKEEFNQKYMEAVLKKYFLRPNITGNMQLEKVEEVKEEDSFIDKVFQGCIDAGRILFKKQYSCADFIIVFILISIMTQILVSFL